MRINRNFKKLIISMIIMMSMLMMSSCETFDSFKHTFIDKAIDDSNTIYIGVLESETGKNADKGNAQIKGINLAHKIYNNVNGQDVKLITVDDKSSTSTAKDSIEELVKMEPVAIIGSAGNATSLIASMYVGKAKIPTITPSATNPLIAQNNGYCFMAGSTASQQAAGMAEYAYTELKSRNIAIVNIKNESVTDALVKSFKNRIKELQGPKSKEELLMVTLEVNITDEDFQATVRNLKMSGAETVLLPLGAGQANALFTEVEKYGMTNVTFLGTEEWGSEEFQKMLKNHPDIKVAFPYNSLNLDRAKSEASVTSEARRFLIEYEKMYGEEDIPTQDAALGYDSYLLIINAISSAGSLKGSDIRQALIDLSGIHCSTGVYEFSTNGTTYKSVNVATVSKGNIVPVYTTKTATTAETIEDATEVEETEE